MIFYIIEQPFVPFFHPLKNTLAWTQRIKRSNQVILITMLYYIIYLYDCTILSAFLFNRCIENILNRDVCFMPVCFVLIFFILLQPSIEHDLSMYCKLFETVVNQTTLLVFLSLSCTTFGHSTFICCNTCFFSFATSISFFFTSTSVTKSEFLFQHVPLFRLEFQCHQFHSNRQIKIDKIIIITIVLYLFWNY